MIIVLIQGLVFLAAGLVFFLVFYRIITRWRSDQKSPVLTVQASVVAKRGHTSRQAYCKTCAVQPSEVSTAYYATFQFESGDRLELQIPYDQIGYLVEGDQGRLTFQGTRFLKFERT